MRRRFLLAALLLIAAPAAAKTRLKAVASFSVLGDLLRQVGGDRIHLAILVGPNADVHSYQPRPADARLLSSARLLVSNGLGLEGWIDRLAEAAEFKGRIVVASAGWPAARDPHCWQDVACARHYVANIASGLAEADPENAAFYRERAERYDGRLAELDDWIRREIATVPAGQRKAITGHASF